MDVRDYSAAIDAQEMEPFRISLLEYMIQNINNGSSIDEIQIIEFISLFPKNITIYESIIFVKNEYIRRPHEIALLQIQSYIEALY